VAHEVIGASEVGQYAYCARAWWLHEVRGLGSANERELGMGRDHHAAHGRAVYHALGLQRWVVVLLGLAILCLVTGVWFWLGGR